MKPTVLTFGEIIWDIYDTKQIIGGAAFNFASHCSRCGINSILISSVGNDDLGNNAIEIAKSNGIDTSFIGVSNHKTGQCIVSLDEKAHPTFNVLNNVAYDYISLSDNDLNLIKETKPNAIYFGTLIQRFQNSKLTLEKLLNCIDLSHVICDINLRKNCYSYDSIELCLEKATILKLSDEEEPILRNFGFYESNQAPKDVLFRISKKYPNIKIILLTCGENGAYAYDTTNQKLLYEPAIKIKPVSSVGAGDSFIAAFVSSYLNGKSLQVCLNHAIKLSAFVVSKAEAVPEYESDSFFD